MDFNASKKSRGRPKTFDRDCVLEFAMHAYWREGIDRISINEICRQCNISKPALYREVGNEDDLMLAVLNLYKKRVFTPMLQLLKTENPFRVTLDHLISIATSPCENPQTPQGCLITKMQETYSHKNENIRSQINEVCAQSLSAYEDWIDRSKAKGELSETLSTSFTAIYIRVQFSYASMLISRGESRDQVKQILTTALSVLD